MNREPSVASTLRYVPALDGVRALSVLSVIVFHLGLFLATVAGAPRWMSHVAPFALGVQMFFVLSGALITSLLVSEQARTTTISLRAFYLRRSRRLGPALVVLVPAVAIGQAFWSGSASHSPLGPEPVLAVITVALFVGNWTQVYQQGDLGWLGPTWSLGIEEQFYLTWPLLLRGLLGRPVRRLAIHALLAVGLISSVVLAAAIQHRYGLTRAHYATPTQLPCLILGCALGYELTVNPNAGLARILRRPAAGIVGLVGAAAVGYLIIRHETYLYRGAYVPFAVFGCLLIGHCVVVAEQPSWVSKMLGWKPFVVIGQVSYEAYLVHCVIILAVLRIAPTMPVADMIVLDLVLIAVSSGVLFYLIEQPIRRDGWLAAVRPGRHAPRPVPASAARPARSLAGLVVGAASATALVVAAVVLVSTAKSPASTDASGDSGQPGTSPVAQGVATPTELLGVDPGGVRPAAGGSAASGQGGAGPGGGFTSGDAAPGVAQGSGQQSGAAATVPAPQIVRVFPAMGTVLGGNTVTIQGRHFTRDARVFFKSVRVRQVTRVDSHTLRVVVPAARMVAVNTALTELHGLKAAVRVVTVGGASAVGVGSLYTYI